MLSTEVILVNTPPDYGDNIWVENMEEMLEYNLHYDSLCVITEPDLGGVYDKIQIFNKCKQDKQYIYLDLDMIIKGDIHHLLRKEFTVLHAWWRDPFHTPLNSSVMSWQGDCSHIYNKFMEDPDYHMIKYHKGIDEFIYKELEYKTYDKVCDSHMWPSNNHVYPITLFNQARDQMWSQ